MIHLFLKTSLGMVVLAFAVTILINDPNDRQMSQPKISAGMQMMLDMTTRAP